MITRAQQGPFRAVVRAAWAVHAPANGLDPSDRAAERAWYEAELHRAAGVRTTKDLGRGREFEAAMAHFEAIVGADITWQLRAATGNRRRLKHLIHSRIRGANVDEAYMRGIAAQALRLDPDQVDLDTLPPESLKLILVAVIRQLQRRPGTQLHGVGNALDLDPPQPRYNARA